MHRILVVDDERNVLQAFQELLGDSGHQVATAERAEHALRLIRDQPFDLVIMDICLSGMDGLEALKQLKQWHPTLPVIVMTGHGTMRTAIEATKSGAFEYHLKPFDPADMLATVDKALESARLVRGQVTIDPEFTESLLEDAIVGRSPGMQQVYKAIGRVALTDATVLIRGESGTGKELVARAIHQHSTRGARPLMAVNCAAIPEPLLESELFGHERGAFTGAVSRKIGKFEQADGGTILLDEIGDMPPGTQAKILRVLQERCFQRVGGNETVRVDVRMLAATNRDLEQAMSDGGFREDLYHRLNVVVIHVPPLRERREDIPRLTDYFLARHAREMELAKPPIAPDAQRMLHACSWPGNVRQLEHCIQRALIFTQGRPIQAADVRLDDGPAGPNASASPPLFEDFYRLVERFLETCTGDRVHQEFLEHAEKCLIAAALRRSSGNQTQAAALLGMARPTLHAKLRKYALVDAPDDGAGT
jgi:nitrogen regulation protein NR(I)